MYLQPLPLSILQVLKDKFTLGMHIISLEKKYGNLLRYTMMKDLRGEKKIETLAVVVDMSDVMKQQSLLEDGWIGVGLEEDDGIGK